MSFRRRNSRSGGRNSQLAGGGRPPGLEGSAFARAAAEPEMPLPRSPSPPLRQREASGPPPGLHPCDGALAAGASSPPPPPPPPLPPAPERELTLPPDLASLADELNDAGDRSSFDFDAVFRAPPGLSSQSAAAGGPGGGEGGRGSGDGRFQQQQLQQLQHLPPSSSSSSSGRYNRLHALYKVKGGNFEFFFSLFVFFKNR